MNMQTKTGVYNLKVRLLLFFARPLHIFNIFLFFKMWQLMSYGPSTFSRYWGKFSAKDVTISLWQDEFSSYVWIFFLVALLDMIGQEFLPLIRND